MDNRTGVSGKKRRRSTGQWVIDTLQSFFGSPQAPSKNGSPKNKQKPRTNKKNRRTPKSEKPIEQSVQTPKPQNIDIDPPFSRDREKSNPIDPIDSKQDQTQGDFFVKLEQKIQGGLTPEEQKRLLSSIQRISNNTQIPSVPQTPTQSTLLGSATPNFRLSTPIRLYTAPIQKSPAATATLTNTQLKRPTPVYSPMTPIQHIKQTAFRTSQQAGSSSAKKLQRKSKIFPTPISRASTNFSAQPQIPLPTQVPETEEPPRKKRLYVQDVLDAYSKPSYALEVAVGILDALDKISSPLVPAKTSVEEQIREKYVKSRGLQIQQDNSVKSSPTNNASNIEGRVEPYTQYHDTESYSNQYQYSEPTFSSHRTRSYESSRSKRLGQTPYGRNSQIAEDDDEEEIISLPKATTEKSFAQTSKFENNEFINPLTPDCTIPVGYSAKPRHDKVTEPPSLAGYPSTSEPIECYSPSNSINSPYFPGEDHTNGDDDSSSSSGGNAASSKNPFAEVLTPKFNGGHQEMASFVFGSDNEKSSDNENENESTKKSTSTRDDFTSVHDIEESASPDYRSGTTKSNSFNAFTFNNSPVFPVNDKFTFGNNDGSEESMDSQKEASEGAKENSKDEPMEDSAEPDNAPNTTSSFSIGFSGLEPSPTPGAPFVFGSVSPGSFSFGADSDKIVKDEPAEQQDSSASDDTRNDITKFSFGSSGPVSFTIDHSFSSNTTFGLQEKPETSQKQEEPKHAKTPASGFTFGSSEPVSFSIGSTFAPTTSFGSCVSEKSDEQLKDSEQDAVEDTDKDGMETDSNQTVDNSTTNVLFGSSTPVSFSVPTFFHPSTSFGSQETKEPTNDEATEEDNKAKDTFTASENVFGSASPSSFPVSSDTTFGIKASTTDDNSNDNGNKPIFSFGSAEPVSFSIAPSFASTTTFGSQKTEDDKSEEDKEKDNDAEPTSTPADVSEDKEQMDSEEETDNKPIFSFGSAEPVSFSIAPSFASTTTFGSQKTEEVAEPEKEGANNEEVKDKETKDEEKKSENTSGFVFGSANPVSFTIPPVFSSNTTFGSQSNVEDKGEEQTGDDKAHDKSKEGDASESSSETVFGSSAPVSFSVPSVFSTNIVFGSKESETEGKSNNEDTNDTAFDFGSSENDSPKDEPAEVSEESEKANSSSTDNQTENTKSTSLFSFTNSDSKFSFTSGSNDSNPSAKPISFASTSDQPFSFITTQTKEQNDKDKETRLPFAFGSSTTPLATFGNLSGTGGSFNFFEKTNNENNSSNK